jgi:drug/metabolite transporter (DMT)-like permease
MTDIWKRVSRSPRAAAFGLLLVAMVWGATFVLTANTLESYPVFAFLGWRFLVAVIAFGLLFARPLVASFKNLHMQSFRTALAAGVFISLGYIFQTTGLIPAELGGTTPARTAFITGFYVVLVPLGQFLLRRQKPRLGIIMGVVFAVIGLWFLSGLGLGSNGGFWVWGDTMVFICSCAYTIHMLILGRTDETYDTLLITFIQLVMVMLICASMSVITQEHASIPQSVDVWFAIAICGVFASAFAFAIQAWAQQVMAPARVALILVLEPAFGGLFGWLAAGLVIWQEFIGAVFMIGGMILSELWGVGKTNAEPALEGPAVLMKSEDD